jgi:hypothetical protein
MADVKPIRMQKRRAMGENVSGMKKGGAVRKGAAKVSKTDAMHKNMRKGGKC